MKQTILFVFLFIFSVSLFSQEIKFDILDVYPVLIDKGSITKKNDKIYLRAHKTDDKELLKSPLAVYPDSVYKKQAGAIFTDIVNKKMQLLQADTMAEIEEKLIAFIQSQPEPERVDPKTLNDFVIDLMLSKLESLFSEDFNFSQGMAQFITETVKEIVIDRYDKGDSNYEAQEVSFDIILDCNNKTLQFESIRIVLGNNTIKDIKLLDEIRDINNSDPRGSNYRLFHKICNEDY